MFTSYSLARNIELELHYWCQPIGMVSAGSLFLYYGAPFYVPLEDMWNNLVRKDATGVKRQVIDVIFWISKFFAFSYLGTAFLLV
ncbi:hypothetical protein DOY81_009580, partial [Sarcophaga bullata]